MLLFMLRIFVTSRVFYFYTVNSRMMRSVLVWLRPYWSWPREVEVPSRSRGSGWGWEYWCG
jgi:hypothetical protein